MEFNTKFEKIQKELKLTQKELALKLDLSTNAISQYITGKRNPDIHTIQKLIELGVSPLFLFGDSDIPFDNIYDQFIKSKKIALKTNNESTLLNILEKYEQETILIYEIKNKVQRLKNLEFLEKLKEIMHGDNERMLILFYAILLNLEKNNLSITTENLNEKFVDIINNYTFNYFETLKFGIFATKKDFTNLKNWIEEELDSISIIEILSSLPVLKDLIKNELGPINKRAISIVEKLFL